MRRRSLSARSSPPRRGSEIVCEEEVALENKVSFREEVSEVILQKEEFVVVIIELFQGEGGCQGAEAHQEGGRG